MQLHLPTAELFVPDGKPEAAALHGDHMGMAALGWVSGCLVIWSSLFAIGNFLYGRMTTALVLTGSFVVSGVVLLYVINHLWDAKRNPSK